MKVGREVDFEESTGPETVTWTVKQTETTETGKVLTLSWAKWWKRGAKNALVRGARWARTRTHSPLRTFQTRAEPSSLPLTSSVPSSDADRHVTAAVWPWNRPPATETPSAQHPGRHQRGLQDRERHHAEN